MFNLSSRSGKILYIVIHDTGVTTATNNAKNNVKYFSGGNRGSSADAFIDNLGVAVFNKQPLKYYSWAVGDGGGKYGITNSNSYSIELCINSDGNYTQTVNNAVAEVKRLMKLFNVDLAHVIRHYDCSRKLCPGSMSSNNWAKWHAFKARLGGATVATSTLLEMNSTGSAVKTLQANLNLLGFNCGTADGYFGDDTYKAVRAFQASKKLAVDGQAGSSTLSAIATAVKIKNTPVVKSVYRVRKSWADVKSQIGAYALLQSAKDLANKNRAYTVYDNSGKAVYKYSAPVVVATKTLEQRVSELEGRVDDLD